MSVLPSQAVPVVCTYRVKPGSEAAFEALVTKHASLLARLGLALPEPALLFKRTDSKGRTEFVEVLAWVNERASGLAHSSPEVMALWEPMGLHTESRDGRPAMEFPHYETVARA